MFSSLCLSVIAIALTRSIALIIPKPCIRQTGKFSTTTAPTQYEYIKDGGYDNSCKAQIPLKIAVAGGGVGGMFLCYALQLKGFDVTLFEKSKKFSRFGGPIQLASNALSCVNAMSPELFEAIMGRFTFTGTRMCGIKDGIRNTWYSVFEAIKNLAEWNDLPYTGVIDRPDLQEILLNRITEGTIINSKGVAGYEEHKGNIPIHINKC